MTVNTKFAFATATLMVQCHYDNTQEPATLDSWFASLIEKHTHLTARMSEFKIIAPYDAVNEPESGGVIQLYCDVAYVGPWQDDLFQNALVNLLRAAEVHGGGVFYVNHRPITTEELDTFDRAPLMAERL